MFLVTGYKRRPTRAAHASSIAIFGAAADQRKRKTTAVAGWAKTAAERITRTDIYYVNVVETTQNNCNF